MDMSNTPPDMKELATKARRMNTKLGKVKLPPNRPKTSKNTNAVTHLYYDHRNLKRIPLVDLSTVCVIYLHNNEITQIENLKSSALTSLYLQCNNIYEIKGLEDVPNVKKLYLGNNEISVLEGIDHLNDLEELHIEKQNLPMGTALCFDPRSIMCISKSLQVLNISGNGIESLSSLAPLRHLRSICASNNRLKDIEEVCELIKSWFYLREAWFLGNPFSKKHRYREDIIGASYCLDFLDDKAVSASTRNFIKCFENEKLKKSSRPSINLEEIVPNLPKNYPLPLKKAVSASLVQNKLHILGPLDTPVEKKLTISHQNKPRLKKKPHHNRTIKEEMNHFPGSFSYDIRLPT